MTSHIETKSFNEPDDHMNFDAHGRIDILKLSDGTAGMRATLMPGWKWSVDEKPLLGNPESCPNAHTGYCLSGELVIRMSHSHEEKLIQEGDFFTIPPEHDAFVPGDMTCELILFQAPGAHTAHSAA